MALQFLHIVPLNTRNTTMHIISSTSIAHRSAHRSNEYTSAENLTAQTLNKLQTRECQGSHIDCMSAKACKRNTQTNKFKNSYRPTTHKPLWYPLARQEWRNRCSSGSLNFTTSEALQITRWQRFRLSHCVPLQEYSGISTASPQPTFLPPLLLHNI